MSRPLGWIQVALSTALVTAVSTAIAVNFPDYALLPLAAGCVVFVFLILNNPEFWLRRLASLLLFLGAEGVLLPSVHGSVRYSDILDLSFATSDAPPYILLCAGIALVIIDVVREERRARNLAAEAAVVAELEDAGIGQDVAPEKIAADRCHELPPLDVDKLIGRQPELESTIKALSEETASVCIVGICGIGKTAVARSALSKIKAKGDRRIVAVDAKDIDSAWALRLEVLRQIRETEPISRKSPKCQDSFIVLDNLDSAFEKDPENVDDLLARLHAIKRYRLLICIRGAVPPSCVQWTRTIHVHPLAPVQATKLFLAVSPMHADERTLQDVVDVADGVPIAIVLLAQNAQANHLSNLKHEWSVRKSAALSRAGVGRESNWKLLLDTTWNSLRLSEAARRLARRIAVLPLGAHVEDLKDIFGEGGAESARLLSHAGLAHFRGDRLDMLGPFREYVLAEHRSGARAIGELAEHYAQTFDTIRSGENAQVGSRTATEWVREEGLNIAWSIAHGIRSLRAKPWMDRAGDFIHRARPLRLNVLREYRAMLEYVTARASESDEEISNADVARFNFYVGLLYLDRRDAEQATTHLKTAERLFQQVGDLHMSARCGTFIAGAAEASGDFARAKQLFSDALLRHTMESCSMCRGGVYYSLGKIWMEENNCTKAEENFERSIVEYRAASSTYGQAISTKSLAYTMLQQGKAQDAASLFESAQKLFSKEGVLDGEADCAFMLAYIARRSLQIRRMAELVMKAFDLYASSQSGTARAARYMILAAECGSIDDAAAYLRLAEGAWEKTRHADLSTLCRRLSMLLRLLPVLLTGLFILLVAVVANWMR